MLGRAFGGLAPREPVEHAARGRPRRAGRAARRRSARRRSAARARRRRRRARSSRPSPLRPTTSGSAPPVVVTSGTPHAIASIAGSEKPSYSDGTTAISASAYSSTMRSSLTPLTNSTAPVSPSRSICAGTADLWRGWPITTRCASSRSVRTLASASMRYVRPLSGTSALAVVINRPGTRADVRHRPELLLVDTDRHDVQRVGIDTHLRDDVLLRVLRHRDVARHLARDVHLHAEEPVPTAQRELAQRRARVREVEVAVDGDRVVQRVARTASRRARSPSRPRAEALVVVHEVELVAPVAQLLVDAAAERVRLGEPGACHDRELLRRRRRCGTRAATARGTGSRACRGRGSATFSSTTGSSATGQGWPGEHRHRVPELGQLAGEVPAVDALAAAVRVASVDEECDAERVAGARQGEIGRRHEETRMEGGPPREASPPDGRSRALASRAR